MSNYTREKVLSYPEGENDKYAKYKHLHSLCKTALLNPSAACLECDQRASPL